MLNAKFFNKEECTMLITSLYYSKLYYGSEVWHLPDRTAAQNKMIKFASANALRTISKKLKILKNKKKFITLECKIHFSYLFNVDCWQSMLTPQTFSWSMLTILLFSTWSTVDVRRRPFYSPFHHAPLNSYFFIFLNIHIGCCVFQPANACLRMILDGQKQSKMLENE